MDRQTADRHCPVDCLDSLEPQSHRWVETHGLDCGPYEHCYQEWYRCIICGTEYTCDEVDRMRTEVDA